MSWILFYFIFLRKNLKTTNFEFIYYEFELKTFVSRYLYWKTKQKKICRKKIIFCSMRLINSLEVFFGVSSYQLMQFNNINKCNFTVKRYRVVKQMHYYQVYHLFGCVLQRQILNYCMLFGLVFRLILHYEINNRQLQESLYKKKQKKQNKITTFYCSSCCNFKCFFLDVAQV